MHGFSILIAAAWPKLHRVFLLDPSRLFEGAAEVESDPLKHSRHTSVDVEIRRVAEPHCVFCGPVVQSGFGHGLPLRFRVKPVQVVGNTRFFYRRFARRVNFGARRASPQSTTTRPEYARVRGGVGSIAGMRFLGAPSASAALRQLPHGGADF